MIIKSISRNYHVPALIKLFSSVKALPESNWRNKKLDEVQNIIIACSALYVEATSSQSEVVQGDSLKIDFVLNERKDVKVTVKKISLENFDSTLLFRCQLIKM